MIMKKKVLVVDDTRTVRFFLEQVLVSAGFDVTCADDGFMALHCIRKCVPDLIMMDIEMPRMNGIECTREIKKRCKNIKIIMVTSRRERDKVSGAFEAGCDGYVTKPIDKQELLDKIEFFLKTSGARSDAAKTIKKFTP
jgi:DNA-binding response OmpR family regulator